MLRVLILNEWWTLSHSFVVSIWMVMCIYFFFCILMFWVYLLISLCVLNHLCLLGKSCFIIMYDPIHVFFEFRFFLQRIFVSAFIGHIEQHFTLTISLVLQLDWVWLQIEFSLNSSLRYLRRINIFVSVIEYIFSCT